jgi:hypothetical protein
MSDAKTKTKILRTTVTQFFNLTNGAYAKSDEKGTTRMLNVQHKCDEVIVRQISWGGDLLVGECTAVTCDLFKESGSILCYISGAENISVAPNSIFSLEGQVRSPKFGFVQYDAGDATLAPQQTRVVEQLILTSEFRGRA